MKLLSLLIASTTSAAAQCIQCSLAAGAQQAAGIAAMNRGILLLLIPVCLLLVGFCWLAYQRRDP